MNVVPRKKNMFAELDDAAHIFFDFNLILRRLKNEGSLELFFLTDTQAFLPHPYVSRIFSFFHVTIFKNIE